MLLYINYFLEWFYSFFYPTDGIKQIYLVGSDGKRRILTIEEMAKPYDHVEMEFVYHYKTFVHVMPVFHHIRSTEPNILSAVLNDTIDITDHVNQYLINDLKYLKVKHVIPPKYHSTFETLEILDEDCNSLVYKKLESRLDFLEPLSTFSSRDRCNSCDNFQYF